MKKKILTLILAFFITFTLFSKPVVLAENGSASKTFTIDANNNYIPTQDAYLALKQVKTFDSVDGIYTYSLNKPEDIYYEETLKQFYIADTGNHRVLVVDENMSKAVVVGEDILKKPQGIFANTNGDIYVADYALGKVIIFLNDGLYTPKEIGKPTHPVYVESSESFKPSKIVCDKVGTMYIIDAGNKNGIVTITSDGEFSGYFGANYVKPNLSFVIKFLFASKEQKKKLYVSPISPSNLAIDDDGLINTISAIKGSALKKLNIAGNNLFTHEMVDWTSFVDVCIGPTGTIYCVEKNGYIDEYDQEGNLLFYFGGKDANNTYIGLFNSPTSIEVDSNNTIYVLDGNMVQVFGQTNFANLIHQALELYYDGKYAESRVPWEQVLQMNNMFDLAHKGLGNAYLREANYDQALVQFKLAKDTASYSDAFWEVRNAWLKSTGYVVIVVIAILIIALWILNKFHVLDKLKALYKKMWEYIFKVKIIREVCYIRKFIKHPLESIYRIKHGNEISILSATILYIIFFIEMVLSGLFTGFVFNTKDVAQISILEILVSSIVPMLLFVVTNYLISSITEGNAKMKHIYIGTICSFAPVILFYPFIILISNYIVDSEAFIYTASKTVLFAWSFGLMFFMVKDLQELQFGENIKNIILTVLTMILFVAFFFLVYILGSELYAFIYDIIREVLSRV